MGGTLTACHFFFGEGKFSIRFMMAGIPFLESITGLSKDVSADLSFFLLFTAMSLALGFFLGRFKLINILINAYIALAFISVLPETVLAISDYAKSGIFVLLLVFLTAIDKRLFDLHISSAGSDLFWRLIVMSLLVSGMLTSMLLSLLPKTTTSGFVTEHVALVFASPLASIVWFAVPIFALLFINNRLK